LQIASTQRMNPSATSNLVLKDTEAETTVEPLNLAALPVVLRRKRPWSPSPSHTFQDRNCEMLYSQ
jgi:hypothetical protein